MSESEPNLEEYRSTSGVDSKFADIASDDHALKARFGNDEDAKRIEFEAEVIGERVAQWYDDPAAALREYLSNAETACVRRARQELLAAGHAVPDSVTEMLATASEEVGYQPVIEVTYNRNEQDTRLVIEDNGIGISTDEYLVLKKIGYSTSHMEGNRLGQFGMGYMSGFQLSGTEGVFNMRTKSFMTEETYSTANYITNFEYLDGLRDDYGTRFEFPSFCRKAQSIDIRSKIAHFADGMRVTVLYREMDSDGQEMWNEDYTPSALASDYPDDAMVISFENEFFEAVMSPTSPNRRHYKTYNISMPIRRNTHEYGSEPNFNAPWTWDFRGKSENGPIVHCESDQSVVGLAPISDSKYQKMDDDRKGKYIARGEVPDDAIVMPVPASSRDSYESGHDQFWQYVSNCLAEQWKQEVAARFEALDDFDDFKNLSRDDKQRIVRGYQKFGPRYGDNDPDNIVEKLEDELGVTVTKDMAEKYDRLQRGHLVVNENAADPSLKGSTTNTRAWEIIDNAGDDGTVYMGKTISPKKANIVWNLPGDNQVVRLEDETYDELADLWGWSKLKDLPTRNLKEELPDLPDDIAEKYETVSAKDMKSSSSGNRRTSKNPKTKRLKVRGGTGRSRRNWTKQSAESIFDALDGGDTISAGYMSASKLIVYYEQEHSVSGKKRHINTNAGIAVTLAPKYVCEYLWDADNIYKSASEIREEEREDAELELSDGTTCKPDAIPEGHVVLMNAETLENRLGDSDALVEWFDEAYDFDVECISFATSSDFNQYAFLSPGGDGHVLRFSGWNGYGSRATDKDGNRIDQNAVLNAILVPDNIDWDHPVMKAMKYSVEGNADKTMTVVEFLREHDCFDEVTKDD